MLHIQDAFGLPLKVFKFEKKNIILKNLSCLVTFQNAFSNNEIKKYFILKITLITKI